MANDKNEDQKEEETKTLQEKYDELLEELDSKNKELAKINEDLEKQKEETQEYISLSQRLQADFENFKKINEKKSKDIIKFANEPLIKNILDSYEDLERALENSKTEKELRDGVELIYSKIKDVLTKEGLEEIPAKGEKFDPFKHEALMVANDENVEKFDPFKHEALMVANDENVENGYIIDELMKGYTLKGKVIKYSKVRVCKK